VLPLGYRRLPPTDGPDFIASDEPYAVMLDEAGFADVAEHDVTGAYRETAARWLEEAEELAPQLRTALGDAFAEKQENRRRSFANIESGHLARKLYTARA
jgi:hypothetical protein